MTEQRAPQIFEDIVLKWGDKKEDGSQPSYKIPSDRVMRAIAIIEEHITLAELGAIMRSGRVPLAKLSGAYASILRFAGCDVTDEQVYSDLFGKTNSGLSAPAIANVVTGLLMMMMPSSVLTEKETAPKQGTGKQKGRAKAS